ncbi:hypothetical protein EG328_002845 [Venturia inaequalis]|uniref:BTB domain-containing protein n=1 Tax=Venturia inaequalis TaxID=5025 RepID=A0A8H3YWA1_VENIN|nr:hypothetical protein EG328_002845 [Venturia inaequalis]
MTEESPVQEGAATSKILTRYRDDPSKFGKKMCRIFVDDDTEPYTVHHDLITASSEFFNRALNGEFEERNGDVKLPEHKSSTFEVYSKWLYSDVISHPPVHDDTIAVYKLYVLGDTIRDGRFRNSVVDFIIKSVTVSNECPVGIGAVNYAFENTPKSSKLTKLLIDFWAYGAQTEWFEIASTQNADGQYPSEFLYEVLRVSLLSPGKTKEADRPWIKNLCQYHDHEDTPDCT